MKVVHCPCGVNVEGESDEALVENVQAHISADHPDLVGKYSSEQILEMAEAMGADPKKLADRARELQPKNIHVAHFVIDGGIKSERRPVPPDRPDSMLDPDAIAQSYLHVLQQPRSAWTQEVELRPWVEKF